MPDTLTRDEIDETSRLISSTKVEGTAVYSRAGDRLGTIQNFMVDKRSGKVEHAVLEFGGFLGLGSDYYPIPWKLLDYDVNQGGYVVDIDKSRLEKAPRYGRDTPPDFSTDYGRQVYSYWDVPYPMM
ncbi:MAG: PRC-barrel domain-containing protein [Sphingobium sp.]|nr:PRC-barrel domain-containing protein [Sphingobium sp.]